jgi:ubiquitin C-terminal hydrolase
MSDNQEENFEEFSNDEENSQDENCEQINNDNEIQEVNVEENQELIESKQNEIKNNEYSDLAHGITSHTNNMMQQFMQNMDLGFNSLFYSNRQLEVEGIKTFLNKDSNHGLTGIKNIGNSCYINTVIQCLSHSVELTYYILAKLYSTEINKTEGNQLIKRGLSK